MIGPNVPKLGFRVDFLAPRSCAPLKRAIPKTRRTNSVIIRWLVGLPSLQIMRPVSEAVDLSGKVSNQCRGDLLRKGRSFAEWDPNPRGVATTNCQKIAKKQFMIF